MNFLKCSRCSAQGLTFSARHILPEEYLEGKQTADIWVVGLNPKGKVGTVEMRTQQEFDAFDPDSHSYFRDFKKVSSKLYTNWKSSKSRVAHTDLVKCFSLEFPPANNPAAKLTIINNCKPHLFAQINKHKPKIIICNGSDVCREMMEFFPPDTTEPFSDLTSYKAVLYGHAFWIVLSGFIGRIDDRNKRRLGKEIEEILQLEKIQLVEPPAIAQPLI